MIHHYVNTNPFLSIRIGINRFADFAKNHLTFLKNNNKNGILDELIAILEASVTEFDAWNSKQDKDTNTKTSKTETLDSIEDDFEDFMKEVWKEVNYKFEDDKPEVFKQFFPNGRSEYINIARTEAPVLLKRIADLTDTHKADLKSGMAERAKTYLTSYTNKRLEQKDGESTVKDGSKDGKTLRAEVAKNMKTVLLELLLIHKDNESEVFKYYDAVVINTHIRNNQNDEDTNPIPPVG